MERFVRLIVGGGLALLAGSWTAALGAGSLRAAGVALALLGAAGIVAGIAVEVRL